MMIFVEYLEFCSFSIYDNLLNQVDVVVVLGWGWGLTGSRSCPRDRQVH